MDSTFLVSSSPHLHSGHTTRRVMLDVLIALTPSVIASVWIFGFRALAVELVCVAACLAGETVSRMVMKRPNTVGDLSAVVTGILLALNLPVSIPLWQAVLGCVVAIVVVKQMFGGLGQNFVNPALVGRIVLTGSFPAEMNQWNEPLAWITEAPDAISSATPLAIMNEGGAVSDSFSTWELLIGNRPGSLGETCVLALLLGGIYLIARRVISPVIPTVYIGTVFILTWILGQDPLIHILSGGLMLGAMFMATDYVTSPINTAGKIVFALGCGLLTVLIRLYGSLPEGVSFSIVIMNIFVPLIERFTQSKPFGERRSRRERN